MNILYIVQWDPRINTGGGNQIRTNLIWEVLKSRGRVFSLVLDKNLKEKHVYVKDEHPICFVNLQDSACQPKVFLFRLVNRLTGLPVLPFPLVPNRLTISLFPHETMDVVVCRYIHTFCFFHPWKLLPTIVDIDDSPMQVFDTVTNCSLPQLLRPIGKWLNKVQTDYVLKHVRGGWISNQNQLGCYSEKIQLLPNIPRTPSEKYNPSSERDEYLFTIGVMGYPPNFMGVERFLNTIWPSFHENYPQVKYIIGGRNAPKVLADRWNSIDGVSYVGYVDDLEEMYAKCLAAVVPIYAGGGTCIKTLEALAYSRTCITTPFGARGLLTEDIRPLHGLCVFRDSSEFIQAFREVVDENIRTEMENGGARFYRDYCSLDKFTEAVEKVLDNSTEKGKL